jgi:hypothetical protein
MNVAALIVREFVGMFFDDEFLALAILAVVAIAAALRYLTGASQIVTGATLLFGCVAVLGASCLRTSRKR